MARRGVRVFFNCAGWGWVPVDPGGGGAASSQGDAPASYYSLRTTRGFYGVTSLSCYHKPRNDGGLYFLVSRGSSARRLPGTGAGSQRQEAPRFFPASPPRGPSRSSTNCRCTMQNPRKGCTMQRAQGRTRLNLPNSFGLFLGADPFRPASPSHAADNEESTPSRARRGS